MSFLGSAFKMGFDAVKVGGKAGWKAAKTGYEAQKPVSEFLSSGLESAGKGGLSFAEKAFGASGSMAKGFGKGFIRANKTPLGQWATGVGISTALSGGLYGLTAGMTSEEASSKPAHYAKYGAAAGIDIASDAALTGLGMLIGGPIGVGLAAYSLVGGFFGVDPGSISLKAMDKMDEIYDRASGRSAPYAMNQNQMMALQKQMQTLQGSQANIAEVMHT